MREEMAATAESAGKPPPSLLYLVKRAELVIRARLEEVLKPAGVTALQYTALTVLQREDGLTAARLARDSFVTAQSMAEMLRTLEARGYVVRRDNPANRRERLIALTLLGHRLLAEYAQAVEDVERAMTEGLSARRVTELRSALDHAWRSLS